MMKKKGGKVFRGQKKAFLRSIRLFAKQEIDFPCAR